MVLNRVDRMGFIEKTTLCTYTNSGELVRRVSEEGVF